MQVPKDCHERCIGLTHITLTEGLARGLKLAGEKK